MEPQHRSVSVDNNFTLSGPLSLSLSLSLSLFPPPLPSSSSPSSSSSSPSSSFSSSSFSSSSSSSSSSHHLCCIRPMYVPPLHHDDAGHEAIKCSRGQPLSPHRRLLHPLVWNTTIQILRKKPYVLYIYMYMY